ncbi:hypothetical protein DPMN_160304 [Dreissena polymorpha]|uniref:Uncharacterized protein n=1 Tax=Dreissena polymorpha TaxID=45954 RepID=A0A9D4IRI2_DREPO|nr:hypothetical protein DPMN_160304 [Dreissena polymorpha]
MSRFNFLYQCHYEKIFCVFAMTYQHLLMFGSKALLQKYKNTFADLGCGLMLSNTVKPVMFVLSESQVGPQIGHHWEIKPRVGQWNVCQWIYLVHCQRLKMAIGMF